MIKLNYEDRSFRNGAKEDVKWVPQFIVATIGGKNYEIHVQAEEIEKEVLEDFIEKKKPILELKCRENTFKDDNGRTITNVVLFVEVDVDGNGDLMEITMKAKKRQEKNLLANYMLKLLRQEQAKVKEIENKEMGVVKNEKSK